MRRPTVLVPLDRTMQLLPTLAGRLQTTFADVVSSPPPGRLAPLVSRTIVTNAQGRSADGACHERSQKPVHRNLHVHRRGHHDRLGAYGRAANESGPFAGGGRRLTMTSGGRPSLIATETSSRINRTSHE